MLRRLFALCLVGVLVGCEESPSAGELLKANKPFPFEFAELEDVSGNTVSKADFAGNVLIVDIWGTWCPPCRDEIPHFVALEKKYRDQGLRIVGLNNEKTPDTDKAARRVREFRKENGIAYPCALVTDEFIEQVPDFEGYPTTLFLDRTGKVRLKLVGYNEYALLQAVVEHLLGEKTSP